MSDPSPPRPAASFRRWLFPALLLLAGLALFVWLAPDTEPAGRPSALERLP